MDECKGTYLEIPTALVAAYDRLGFIRDYLSEQGFVKDSQNDLRATTVLKTPKNLSMKKIKEIMSYVAKHSCVFWYDEK